MGALKCAVDIQINDFPPVLEPDVFRRRSPCPAGIVDQDINLMKFGQCLPNYRFDVLAFDTSAPEGHGPHPWP